MKHQDRINKAQEIFKIAKDKEHNISTITFLLATYNDREFEKFYSEYIQQNNKN